MILEENVSHLATHGWVKVEAAIPKTDAERLAELATRRWRERADPSVPYLHEFDFHRGTEFVQLVDSPGVVDVVSSYLGANIYVYHSHLNAQPGNSSLYWHQDMAECIRDLGPAGPCVSVKAAFLLSDVDGPDDGGTIALSGSHLTPPEPFDRREQHPDQMILTGSVGDCYLFDNRVWHSRGPHDNGRVRIAAHIAYAYRWLRPRDYFPAPAPATGEYPARLAQLLGLGDKARDFHITPGDLPLERHPAHH
jgi:ectoine hydroxylase-related dioxygenase (phytanoyl-CoA dioxygenase family)